jgi:hypothetical protein
MIKGCLRAEKPAGAVADMADRPIDAQPDNPGVRDSKTTAAKARRRLAVDWGAKRVAIRVMGAETASAKWIDRASDQAPLKAPQALTSG